MKRKDRKCKENVESAQCADSELLILAVALLSAHGLILWVYGCSTWAKKFKIYIKNTNQPSCGQMDVCLNLLNN